MKTTFAKALIVPMFLVSFAISQTTKPTTKPATDSSSKDDKQLPPVLQKAVEVLTKEMEAVVKDPKKATRRQKCDYFAKSKETVAESDLVEALESRLNKNLAIDSYLKWQLLSIHKEPFGDDVAKRILQIYKKTPALPMRPGSKQEDQQEMNQLLNNLKSEQTDEIDKRNKMWAEKIDANFNVVGPIFGYREELYTRLPKSVEAVRAGIEDADTRIMAGYESESFMKKLGSDLRGLASGMKPVEIQPFISLIDHLSGRSGPAISSKIYVTSKGAVAWQRDRKQPQWSKKFCDELSASLAAMTKTGG